MASSSKTKKPRTSGSQSKHRTSSSKSNPLNLTRLLANNEQRKKRDILSAGYLKLEECLLCYFLTYAILPKFSNHSQISDIELQLIYAIKYNIKINWTHMIMRQMLNVRGSQSPLPYVIFITKILEHFSISLDGETKVALNLRESKIDVEVCHKMGFSINPIDYRTYRHRADRPTAPNAQPEPTIHNQPEFQALSSSSAAMPPNQMIMDELVSLRGYIITRMDALDTQNQQIHYELHRLSSRLNNMDVDEDSSEPEGRKVGRNAHNSKRKGSIQDRGSILKTSQEISSSMLLSENYTFGKILVCHHQKGGDCEEGLAHDLDMVLMKTPTSPKRRKEEDLSSLKKTKLQEIESKSYRNLEGKEVEIEYSFQEYEMFRMKPEEKIMDLQKRFTHLINHLIALGKVLSNSDLNLKVLRS
ncbi:hypothetical protein Lal_00018717 [Lupinus albus]|nr:hypothetical protein Lal_00018717 [Lupinus albus]